MNLFWPNSFPGRTFTGWILCPKTSEAWDWNSLTPEILAFLQELECSLGFLVKNSEKVNLQPNVLSKEIFSSLITSLKGCFFFPHKFFGYWSVCPQAFWNNSDSSLVVAPPVHVQVQGIIGTCGLPQIFWDFLSVCTDKAIRKSNVLTTHLASLVWEFIHSL